MTDRSGPGSFPDLVKRSITAAALALASILMTIWGLWPFSMLLVLGSCILAAEWGRIVRGRQFDAPFYVHLIAVISALIAATAHQWTYAWIILISGAILAGALTRTSPMMAGSSAIGVLYLGSAALLLVALRADPLLGLSATIFLFLVVWASDTAAYFTGRALGGVKLAPRISPGKTWSGFAGGLLIPAVLGYGYALWLGNTSAVILACIAGILALASQLGDLVESAIKRKHQVKDAGHILPGHGGLFDRVDGLIGAALMTGILFSLRDVPSPGRALLIW